MPNLDGCDNSGLALLNIGWLGRKIGDVNYRFRCQHPANVGFWVGMDRCTPKKFGEGWM
jgi:hypothetical protein